MDATSPKVPEDLKRRIERLAATARQSPHAFMFETLAREAERAEVREQFATDAAQSEKAVIASGKAVGLAHASTISAHVLPEKKALAGRSSNFS